MFGCRRFCAMLERVVDWSLLNGVGVALSKTQFKVLFSLLEARGPLTQRELSRSSRLGLGTVNAVVRELEALGCVKDRAITEEGVRALEPYRVRNAVILAAGIAQRFAPISYEKPKGMLRVHGEILVERQIEQLRAAGIENIVLVVGYKMEYFFALAKQHDVEVVVNPQFATRNNNSSLWEVRNMLGRTYICSSDNYFTENPYRSYEYESTYCTQFVNGETDEWCVTVGANEVITDVQIGGRDSYVMLGYAYFDDEFAKCFRMILEDVYDDPTTVGKLWEQIYVENLDTLRMTARRCPSGLVHEFDSLDELRDFDPHFLDNVDSGIIDNIVDYLNASRSTIRGFEPLKQGLTNLSCRFQVGDEEYVYRHPGVGTEKMINREAESSALRLARDLGLDDTFLHIDPDSGWKISRFLPDAVNVDLSDNATLSQVMRMSRRLHESGAQFDVHFDFIKEGLRYEQILREMVGVDVPGYAELKEKVLRLKGYADADGFPVVPSHNDFFHMNMLTDQSGRLHLIDWEYAGMSDQANDFGTMVVCSQLSDEVAEAALAHYFGRPPTHNERRHFLAYVVFAGWAWYVWSLAKEAQGEHVGEWLHIYYTAAAENVDRVLGMYESDREGGQE